MVQKLGIIRTKERTIPTTNDTTPLNIQYNSAHVQIGTYGGYNRNTSWGSDQIAYTTKRKAFRHLSNMCIHTTSRSRYMGNFHAPKTMFKFSPSGYYDTYYSHHPTALDHMSSSYGSFCSAAGISTAIGSDLEADAQAFINDGAARLRPDLTTLSVPNFLADIKDVRKLFLLWKQNVSLAKNLAGAHLNYKFGWKPTLGDLSSMISVFRKMEAKLAAFEAALGQVHHRSATMLDETLAMSGSNIFSTYHRNRWSGTARRKVTVHFVWTPQPLAVMGGMQRLLRAYLDALGFELNPKIIWDALPFTFVLDWFFDVGGWLNNFKIDTLELPIKYLDSYVQISETRTVENYVTLHELGGTFSTSAKSASAISEERSFRRIPILPDYSVLTGLGWKMPKLDQWALLVSLGTVLKK